MPSCHKRPSVSATHKRLQESVEALKASLKALNGTRISPDNATVLELKKSIRRSIAVTEKLLEEHSRPLHFIISKRAA